MQVLLNILNNAIHILQNKKGTKEITILAHCSSTKLEIIINDNGGGIHIDDINKVFEKNFTTKENKKGTGLGLYICKHIMEQFLQGRVEVKNIDNGASFTINLPIK